MNKEMNDSEAVGNELEIELCEKKKLVESKMKEFKKVRDELNALTKQHLTARNSGNDEVKDLITKVREQRTLRNEHNKKVREHKSNRSKCNILVKKATNNLKKLSGENTSNEERNPEFQAARDELRRAHEIQEEAHQKVKSAAEAAQVAHNSMMNFNKTVDEKRTSCESYHRQGRRSKKEADAAHYQFIVCMNSLKNIEGMLRAIKFDQYVNKSKVEVDEVSLQQDSASVRELSEEEFESSDDVLDDLGL
jgi:uncharacterized coiled-coil DUF342 family protein